MILADIGSGYVLGDQTANVYGDKVPLVTTQLVKMFTSGPGYLIRLVGWLVGWLVPH